MDLILGMIAVGAFFLIELDTKHHANALRSTSRARIPATRHHKCIARNHR
jgi:hypothetical protein